MTVHVTCVFDVDATEHLVGEAIRCGFLRADSSKRWSDKEKKEAIQFALDAIIGSWLERKS